MENETIIMSPTSKVHRGMVFWYNPVWAITKSSPLVKESDINPNGSIEFKRRPYVVISNDTSNFYAPTVNLLAITTRPHGTLPCHVEFTYNGRPQVILAESPVTANIVDLDAYMYTLSPDIMAKLDEAIRSQFDVHESVPIALSTLENRLNEMVGRIITAARAQQEAKQVTVALTNSKIEDVALNLAEQVENLLGEMTPAPSAVVEAAESHPGGQGENLPSSDPKAPKLNSETKREPVEWAMPSKTPEQGEKKPKKRATKGKKQQKPTPQQTSSEGIAVQPKKPGKPSKYSVEFMVKYLRDFDIYPPRMMCDRYGINERKALYPKKYYFLNRLEEMGIDYKTYELPKKEDETK